MRSVGLQGGGEQASVVEMKVSSMKRVDVRRQVKSKYTSGQVSQGNTGQVVNGIIYFSQ